MHGRLGAMHVLGVPGNPVSSFVCGFLFLVPLIRRLAGRSDLAHRTESAMLGCDLPANDERADYLRATLEERPAAARRNAFPGAGQFHDGCRWPRPIAWSSESLMRRRRKRAAAARSLNSSVKRSFGATARFLHFKLNGCGTHMERIVSVHDLFRP